MDAPAVAVSNDGKTIAAAWMDMRAGGRGVQWTVGAPGRLSPETTLREPGKDSGSVQGHPSLVFDASGTAWCAWEDTRRGPNQQGIFATDSKTRKTLPVSAPEEGRCGFPALAAAGPRVGVAYESPAGILFRRIAGD